MAEKKLFFTVGADIAPGSKAFGKLARDAKKSMGDVDTAIEGTESAGKQLAKALEAQFEQIDAAITETKATADVLATAMGPELSGKIDSTAVVQEFQRLGLTLDDIKADADALATALKSADDVSLKHLGDQAGAADTSVRGLRDSSDQSRSVLANMVGNSVQDLGMLGGVAGTAGMAVGQLGEYAAEGNIKMGALAKVAGPMAVLGLGVLAVSNYMKGIAESKAFVKERVDGFRAALDDAVVSAGELQDILNADEISGVFAEIGNKFLNVDRSIAATTGTFADFQKVVQGGTDGFNEWVSGQLRAAEATGATEGEIANLATALQRATESTNYNLDASEAIKNGYGDVWMTAQALTQAIGAQGTAMDQAGFAAEFYGDTTKDATTAVGSAADDNKVLADRYQAVADKAEVAATQQEAFNDALNSQEWDSAPIDAATTAMEGFTTQQFGLGDLLQAQEDAWRNYTGLVKENGLQLDVATEKGGAQQDALRGIADVLDTQLAAAYDDAAGDGDKFRESAINISNTLRDRLRRELGLSEEDAGALIDQLGLTPEDIETRYKLSGDEEARVKIGLLQGAIENLPDVTRLQVENQIINGDYAGALRTIQDHNNRNPTAVDVNAQPGDVAGGRNAVQDYNNRNPTTVRVNSEPGSTRIAGMRAGGGPVEAGEAYVVGEQHAELFVPDQDGTIYPSVPSRGNGTAVGGGGGATTVVNQITVRMPPGTDGRDLVRQLRRHERYNGSDWRTR